MQLSEISIRVHPNCEAPKKRGEFNIYVQKDSKIMFIPADFYNFILVEHNARTAQTVMEYLHSRPQTVAKFLKWNAEDVKVAFQKLVAHVSGVLNMPKSATQGKKR